MNRPARWTVARAPGKVLLAGEYAVLMGWPALVMAVDRHARVGLIPAGMGSVEAPELGLHGARFTVEADRVHWSDGRIRGRLGLTAAVFEGLVKEFSGVGRELPPFRLRFESSRLFMPEPRGKPVKLGLGSSAAVSAALYTALAGRLDDGRFLGTPSQNLARLLPVYRRAQGGTASGADLAASLAGGLIEYRDVDGRREIRRVAWPEGLAAIFVWTGRPASTTRLVSAFDEWRTRAGAAGRILVARLGEGTKDLIAAFERGQMQALVRTLDSHRALLERLELAIGQPVLGEEHRRLEGLAREAGVAYKSCGAGGGDVGVALADDPGRLERFAEEVRWAGLVPLELGLEAAGAELVSGTDFPEERVASGADT